jgi:hypothetical protein
MGSTTIPVGTVWQSTNQTHPNSNLLVSSSSAAAATISPNGVLEVNGDAVFNGDIMIKGMSLAESLELINKRLSILIPDPNLLEKYAALQNAYDDYKHLEALLYEKK